MGSVQLLPKASARLHFHSAHLQSAPGNQHNRHTCSLVLDLTLLSFLQNTAVTSSVFYLNLDFVHSTHPGPEDNLKPAKNKHYKKKKKKSQNTKALIRFLFSSASRTRIHLQLLKPGSAAACLQLGIYFLCLVQTYYFSWGIVNKLFLHKQVFL